MNLEIKGDINSARDCIDLMEEFKSMASCLIEKASDLGEAYYSQTRKIVSEWEEGMIIIEVYSDESVRGERRLQISLEDTLSQLIDRDEKIDAESIATELENIAARVRLM